MENQQDNNITLVKDPAPHVETFVGDFLDKILAPESTPNTPPQTKAPEAKAPETVVAKAPEVKPEVKPEAQKPAEVKPVTDSDGDLDHEDLDPMSRRALKRQQAKPASEEKPADATKPEVDLEKVDVPADSSPAAKKAFAIARGEAAKLRAELKELREKGSVPQEVVQELETVKRQLVEYQQRDQQAQEVLYRTQLEETELYKQEVAGPKETILHTVHKIGTNANINPEDIWNVVTGRTEQKQGKEAVDALVSQLSDTDKFRLIRAQDEYATLQAKDTALRQNQKATVEAANAAQQARQRETEKTMVEESAKVFSKYLDQVRNALSQDPLFVADETDEQSVKDRIARIHTEAAQLDPKAVMFNHDGMELTMTSLNPAQIARATYALPVSEYLYEVTQKQQETIAKLTKRLNKLKSGNPIYTSGNGNPNAPIIKNGDTKGKDLTSVIDDFVKKVL